MRRAPWPQFREPDIHEKQNRTNAVCAKALAHNPSLSIDPGFADYACRLGLLIPSLDPVHQFALPVSRAVADAIAMVDLHHDSAAHARLRPHRLPDSMLFDEMELTRCKSLGALDYAGVSSNLNTYWNLTSPAGSRSLAPLQQLRYVFAIFTRRALGVHWLPSGAANELTENYQQIPLLAPDQWSELLPAARNQSQFASLCLAIIAALPRSIIETVATDKTPAEQTEADDENKPADDDSQQESETTEEDSEDPTATVKINIDLREAPEPAEESRTEDDDDQTPDDVSGVNRHAPVQDGDTLGTESASIAAYTVYSTLNDEVINAETLCSTEELNELRKSLDEQIEKHARVVNSLAGKLQRLLMAQQQRHWIFDLEEGQLDTSQLTRVVTRPRSALSFKQESEIQFRDTTVTLLVDNSRSMLGKPIAIAAACADLLAQTLERCGVSVEVLGFTTTELHGGENAEHWQHAGGTINPGRLNSLRHIIYKPASAPYRRARRGIGLMLRSELLKQNIDGEALLWANQRLARRGEQRKILMVISDGAPLDTSTMAANQENILIEHLHQVIAGIEKRGAIELVAIGIGHDVSRFYQRATNIYDSRYLGRAMLSQLTELFAKKR